LERLLLFLFIFSCITTTSAQQFSLRLAGTSDRETAIIDSIGYVSPVPNSKAAADEANAMTLKIQKAGYLSATMREQPKPDDSTFLYRFGLGKKTEVIHIYTGKNSQLQKLGVLSAGKDTVTIPFADVEGFINRTLALLESKGYSLAKLKLINFDRDGDGLTAELYADTGTQRHLNDIVISGYEKFPEGHKKNIARMYRNKTFNQETLNNLYDDFSKFRFVNQTKYPEILFTKDTTKVYVYLEKAKPNRFDGLIGFSNDAEQEKLVFTGYLDLMLVNIMNSGEELTLYWKSDGNEQKTFNAAIDLPYIFKTPFGLKAGLNIFKQDSTFQNTRTNIDLGYFFNYNTRLYLGYQATESSDIQNQNNFSINDYKNTFLTTNFIYTDYRPDDFLFPEKTRVSARIGAGKRDANLSTNNQLFAELNLGHNIYLNERNLFNIRSQNYYLKSDEYIINELYRFGGINSIRGFNENSLQANFLASLLTEYRHVPAPNIYVHSIIDYGYFRDESSANSGGLLGLGFGFGLLTKNGLLNLVYANGSTDEQSIRLSNSIVHISFKATF
jgi:hypothetical protein